MCLARRSFAARVSCFIDGFLDRRARKAVDRRISMLSAAASSEESIIPCSNMPFNFCSTNDCLEDQNLLHFFCRLLDLEILLELTHEPARQFPFDDIRNRRKRSSRIVAAAGRTREGIVEQLSESV